MTSFSKVIEKALYNRLIDYLNNNSLINSQQFGFRRNLSTDNAIFNLTHEILKALNNKMMVASIFFDLEKAFDSINHALLINKLPQYGIQGKSKLLIESYLTNRFQRVQLHNSFSDVKMDSMWMKVKRGVPQGSILGPLLFILYINDLPKAIMQNVIPIMFADDTSILITRQDTKELQEDLTLTFNQVSEWFKQNSLSLNINKTYLTHYHSKRVADSDINITYENNRITIVNELKFLGLNITDTLTWNSHIETILPKLGSACFAMRSIKPFLSQQMLKAIYYSQFHSIILYGLIFWGNSPHSARVFGMQKRIIRIMTGRRSGDSCRKLFSHLNILPLPSLYIFFILRFIMKNRELFVTNNQIYQHGTRRIHNFHFPQANLKKYQSGVFYMGIKIFNNLPPYIKMEFSNPIKFELLIKKFLLKHTFYSLDEFYNSV